jgi:hypothetical protein
MNKDFINNNQNKENINNSNIFLTIEDLMYYLFAIYFFTNATKLYGFYNKNKTNIDEKIIKLCNKSTKYAVTIKNSVDQHVGYYINLIKQYYTPKIESNNDETQSQVIEKKPEIKYEDKYLQEIRNMPKIYTFTEEELKLEAEKVDEFSKIATKELEQSKIVLINEINKHKKNLKKIEEFDYDDCSEDGEEKAELKTEEAELKEGLELLQMKLEELNTAEIDIEDIKNEAKDFVIKERLDKMKYNFIIEKTPLGNVIMIYNNVRGTFDYYSDSNIPYRFLETVGRKYVLTFNCRPIFIDMEEELKLYELKLKEKEDKEKAKEEEKANGEKEDIKEKNDIKNDKKKNVFAKFKSYNREAGSGKVNTAAPPKNSIPNTKITDDTKKNEKMILKENANRYTCEGRFSNFNILQKVDRKKVDKKYSTTFADFKKMQLEKKQN